MESINDKLKIIEVDGIWTEQILVNDKNQFKFLVSKLCGIPLSFIDDFSYSDSQIIKITFNKIYNSGDHPIHYVVVYGDVDALCRWLNAGVTVDIRTRKYNSTPLMIACQTNHDNVAIIQELINYGADVNATDIDGENAFHRLDLLSSSQWNMSKAKLLIEAGCESICKSCDIDNVSPICYKLFAAYNNYCKL